MGGAFAFTDAFVANERQTEDHLNKAAGGCAAGFLAGMRSMYGFAFEWVYYTDYTL